MRSLQSLPINTNHGIVYGDLRLPIYHGLLAGSRIVDAGEDMVMKNFITAGDIVFDIGALAGVYTLALAEYAGDEGKVFVFEPNRTLLPTLERTCRELRNAFLSPVALSDREGRMSLFVPADDASMSSLRNWTGGVGGEVKEISCETRRLDDLVKTGQIALPDFIKCDVEGAELAVFRGAENTLNREDAPCILFEVNPQATAAFGVEINEPFEFLGTLGRAGYSFYDIRESGLVVFEDVNSLVIENGFFRNVVAVPSARRHLAAKLVTS